MSQSLGPEHRSQAEEHGLPVLPPLTALAELGVFVGAIVGADWLLPNFDPADMQPNPYWLPVLLLSLQYGTVSGLLAAGVAVLATVLSGLPEQGVGENHFSYLLRIWAQPILWIAVSVLLGQFRLRQIAEKRDLQLQRAELTSQRSAISQYAGNLRSRCESLERELAGREAGANRIGQLALLRDGTGTIEADFERFARATFPDAALGLYLLEGDVLKRRQGGEGRADYKREDALFQSVVTEGATLSVLQARDEVRLMGDGLAAVPIRAGGSGAVVGLLKLERCAARALDETLLVELGIVAELVGARLAAAAAPQQAMEGSNVAVLPRAAEARSGSPTLGGRHVRRLPGAATEAATDLKRPKIG